MKPPNPDAVARLAQALHVSPRQALVCAARWARLQQDTAAAPPPIPTFLHRARADRVGAAGALLLTPVASYAQDDCDRALASLWPPDR